MLPATQHVVDVFRGVFSYKFHAVYMLLVYLYLYPISYGVCDCLYVCMHVCMYEGDSGILSTLRPGSVVIDSSTIDPLTTKLLHEEVAAKGAAMIDAPVRFGYTHADDRLALRTTYIHTSHFQVSCV